MLESMTLFFLKKNTITSSESCFFFACYVGSKLKSLRTEQHSLARQEVHRNVFALGN